MKARLRVHTPDPRGDLDRLTAHFRRRHGFIVTARGGGAAVAFPDGVCVLDTAPDGLAVTLKVWDHAVLWDAQAFFTRHLRRLTTGRSSPELVWSSAHDGPSPASPEAQLAALAAILDQAAPPAARA